MQADTGDPEVVEAYIIKPGVTKHDTYNNGIITPCIGDLAVLRDDTISPSAGGWRQRS